MTFFAQCIIFPNAWWYYFEARRSSSLIIGNDDLGDGKAWENREECELVMWVGLRSALILIQHMTIENFSKEIYKFRFRTSSNDGDWYSMVVHGHKVICTMYHFPERLVILHSFVAQKQRSPSLMPGDRAILHNVPPSRMLGDHIFCWQHHPP